MKKTVFILVVAISAVTLAVLFFDNQNRRFVVVESGMGSVKGVEKSGLDTFTGIPFAKPPVGALRFSPPEPLPPAKALVDATRKTPACIQSSLWESGVWNESEDCLTLNILRKSDSGNDKRPVMVWIYGGGFTVGSKDVPAYDGTHLVMKNDVIFITLNYRVGLWGFLALPDDSEESGQATGNYGLMDQAMALRWIHENIAAFGGDPDNVTVFGESAGAVSACMLLASDYGKGLFAKAIIQSGSCSYPTVTLEEAQSHGRHLATLMGCSDNALQCLRSLDISEIKKRIKKAGIDPSIYNGVHRNSIPRIPVLDGRFFEMPPNEYLASGKADPVPVIIGANRNEGTMFLSSKNIEIPSTEEEYRYYLDYQTGQSADAIAALYPPAGDDYFNPLADFVGDASITCGVLDTAEALSAGGHPVYTYLFNETVNDLWFRLYVFAMSGRFLPELGAFHSVDIPFVFHTHPLISLNTPEQKKTAEMVMAYWINFARSDDPNRPGLPLWKGFSVPSLNRLDVQSLPGHGTWAEKKQTCTAMKSHYIFSLNYRSGIMNMRFD